MSRNTIVFTLLLLTAGILHTQETRTRIIRGDSIETTIRSSGEENTISLPELSAVIGLENGGLVVHHILEAQMRPKGYEKTDMQEGDLILMADGKKINGLEELKHHYQDAAIGSTMKLGIKRNNEMMIVSFIKADPKNLPVVRMIMTKGGTGDVLVIPQLGLIFGSKGDHVIVRHILEDASKHLTDFTVKADDPVTALNGSQPKSFKSFREQYEKIPVGKKVELSISHEGKTETTSFIKQKDDGKVIIRR